MSEDPFKTNDIFKKSLEAKHTRTRRDKVIRKKDREIKSRNAEINELKEEIELLKEVMRQFRIIANDDFKAREIISKYFPVSILNGDKDE